MRTCDRHNHDKGLTLIETMIALTLLLAVVGLLAGPVARYYQVTQRNQNTSTSVNAAQTAMEAIRAKLTESTDAYTTGDLSGIPLTGLTVTCTPLDYNLVAITGQTCSNYASPLKRILLRHTGNKQQSVTYQLDLAMPQVKTVTP